LRSVLYRRASISYITYIANSNGVPGICKMKSKLTNCIALTSENVWRKQFLYTKINNETLNYLMKRGVRGRVVKVVDFKSLAPHRCGFNSQKGLWILSCEEAIQLAYGTSVVRLRCPFVPEIMHGRAPEFFLHQ
jgi:hypothetical protein